MKDVCFKPTVKYGGGSIIVCECSSANGVDDLVIMDGILNAENYKQILIHHAIHSDKGLICNGFIFQWNNDPKHTTQKVI